MVHHHGEVELGRGIEGSCVAGSVGAVILRIGWGIGIVVVVVGVTNASQPSDELPDDDAVGGSAGVGS